MRATCSGMGAVRTRASAAIRNTGTAASMCQAAHCHELLHSVFEALGLVLANLAVGKREVVGILGDLECQQADDDCDDRHSPECKAPAVGAQDNEPRYICGERRAQHGADCPCARR